MAENHGVLRRALTGPQPVRPFVHAGSGRAAQQPRPIGQGQEAFQAAQLRGQGVALFRAEVARGMSQAAEQMKQANLDTNVILFSMWTEAVKNFAQEGKGNVIFLDGSVEGMERTMKEMMALNQLNQNKSK